MAVTKLTAVLMALVPVISHLALLELGDGGREHEGSLFGKGDGRGGQSANKNNGRLHLELIVLIA
jgi:hypothetical protein